MMEELLFGLTPAEWWVWNYLILLAQNQKSYHVILPRPGEDARAEKIISRRHFKRLLKNLRAKFYLTKLIIPRSKSNRIELILPASKIGVLNVRNVKEGDIQDPKVEGLGTRRSAITTLRTFATPISNEVTRTLPHLEIPKLSLKEVINKMLELKQSGLREAIKGLQEGKVLEVIEAVGGLVKFYPRARGVCQGARLFAMVRFLQNGSRLERPQAWIDTVAREVNRTWNEDASGSDGRSQSPGGSGVTSASMWARP